MRNCVGKEASCYLRNEQLHPLVSVIDFKGGVLQYDACRLKRSMYISYSSNANIVVCGMLFGGLHPIFTYNHVMYVFSFRSCLVIQLKRS